jgi:hypothetical protein
MALLLIVTGSAPRARNVSATISPAGTRMRSPVRSAGIAIGRLEPAICRMPLSNAPAGKP